MKYEKSAGVVVYKQSSKKDIDKEVLYLLLRSAQGHWDFPKGKMEPGETTQEAALRELHEEAGLSVELDKEFNNSVHYMYKDRKGQLVDKTVVFYLGELKRDASVILSHEHTYFKWLNLKDALEQVSYNNSREILSLADIYIKTNI